MDDMISRQAAIEAVQNRHMMLSKEKVLLINDLEKLPSAQPTFDARDTQYNIPIGTDLISRQTAIDDIWTVSPLARLDRKWVDRWLRRLPSAQPEPPEECERCMMEHTDEMEKLEAELAIAKSKQPEPCEDAVSREKVKELAYSQIRSEYSGIALKEQREAMLRIADNVIGLLAPVASKQPEIVRCKDCKHWIPYEWMFSEVWQSKNIADYPEDEIGCNLSDMSMKANDFCSRGERREDG